ncbi:MAG: ferritin-like domain-containing protein [Planctomycetota bacterium]|jgi:hypothetical protein
MDKFESFDDVLDYAIEREAEANQFYADLATKMKSPAMREVFEGFALEELAHKTKLEAMRSGAGIQPAGDVTDLRIADYTVEVEPTPDMDYQDALVLTSNYCSCQWRRKRPSTNCVSRSNTMIS